MAATVRLMRLGKRPATYRIVVIDKKILGIVLILRQSHLHSSIRLRFLQFKSKKTAYWQGKGAELSDGFAKLLKGRKESTSCNPYCLFSIV